MRKLILYIAASLDGYIAGPGDNLDFLDSIDHGGEDYGYHDFIDSVDTVILGRRTYDWVLERAEFPHKNKQTFILTRTERPAEGNLTFYSGDVGELVQRLKSEPGKHIFCDGGAQVVHALLERSLIDELIISVAPVLLGDGIRLFSDGRPQQPLELLSARTYSSGMLQMHYRKKG
jgi:dihydrofolate reductase